MKSSICLVIIFTSFLCLENYQPSHALFTSRDNITHTLVSLIDQEQRRIRIASATLTSKPIQEALLRAKTRGVDIEIIVDKEWVDNNPSATKSINALEHAGIPVFKFNGTSHRAFPAIMHHKFSCFYHTSQYNCTVVCTGSFNYTQQANINCENIIINYEPHIFEQYLKEFESLKQRILTQTKQMPIGKIKLQHPSVKEIKHTNRLLRQKLKKEYLFN